MEKHEFMPRSAPPADVGPLDLPPHDACPLTPSPRMERPAEQSVGGDCGCEHHNGDSGPSHSGQTACGCVGYEGCGPDSLGVTGRPVAMVYAPCQAYHALYNPAAALHRGTLFTELDLPLGSDCAGFTTADCACRAERRGV